MPDAAELVKAIKKTAIEAVNATKPVEVCYGKVVGVSPLKILVEQKMVLGAAQLIVPKHLTDYVCEMTVDHTTENNTASHTHTLTLTSQDCESCVGTVGKTELTHYHKYKGRKSFIVHNGLAAGDEVILLRQQGGQKYIVWDKIA